MYPFSLTSRKENLLLSQQEETGLHARGQINSCVPLPQICSYLQRGVRLHRSQIYELLLPKLTSSLRLSFVLSLPQLAQSVPSNFTFSLSLSEFCFLFSLNRKGLHLLYTKKGYSPAALPFGVPLVAFFEEVAFFCRFDSILTVCSLGQNLPVYTLHRSTCSQYSALLPLTTGFHPELGGPVVAIHTYVGSNIGK